MKLWPIILLNGMWLWDIVLLLNGMWSEVLGHCPIAEWDVE